jgi:hypothetical protein
MGMISHQDLDRLFGKVRRLDVFSKVPVDYQKRSTSGGFCKQDNIIYINEDMLLILVLSNYVGHELSDDLVYM